MKQYKLMAKKNRNSANSLLCALACCVCMRYTYGCQKYILWDPHCKFKFFFSFD